jgi:hypothetical protein
MTASTDKPRRGIQSVEIGSQLLTALARHVAPMPLRDLAKAAGMSTGKAHPYLVTFLSVDEEVGMKFWVVPGTTE